MSQRIGICRGKQYRKIITRVYSSQQQLKFYAPARHFRTVSESPARERFWSESTRDWIARDEQKKNITSFVSFTKDSTDFGSNSIHIVLIINIMKGCESFVQNFVYSLEKKKHNNYSPFFQFLGVWMWQSNLNYQHLPAWNVIVTKRRRRDLNSVTGEWCAWKDCWRSNGSCLPSDALFISLSYGRKEKQNKISIEKKE